MNSKACLALLLLLSHPHASLQNHFLRVINSKLLLMIKNVTQKHRSICIESGHSGSIKDLGPMRGLISLSSSALVLMFSVFLLYLDISSLYPPPSLFLSSCLDCVCQWLKRGKRSKVAYLGNSKLQMSSKHATAFKREKQRLRGPTSDSALCEADPLMSQVTFHGWNEPVLCTIAGCWIVSKAGVRVKSRVWKECTSSFSYLSQNAFKIWKLMNFFLLFWFDWYKIAFSFVKCSRRDILAKR